jgi:hypothetical protein
VLGFTSLGSLGDTAARSSYTCTLSREPANNALVLVSVLVTDAAGTPVEPTSVAGSGLVFSLATSSVTYAPVAVGTELDNISIWRSMGAGLANSVITVTFPNSANGCNVLVTEVSGVSTSGTSGANAIGKSATSRADAGTSALTIFIPSATSTANGWFASAGATTDATHEVGNLDWPSIDSVSHPTPNRRLTSAYTALSTASRMWFNGAGSRDRGGIVLELVLDNPVVATPSAFTATVPRPQRIPPVPSNATGPLADWCRLAARQLNQEVYISQFSGANPNTSGFSGQPGNLLVNIGSDSTSTRLWVMAGAQNSFDTDNWKPVRVA